MSEVAFMRMGGNKQKSMAYAKGMGGICLGNDAEKRLSPGETNTYIQEISPYDGTQCDAALYKPEWACVSLKDPYGYFAYLLMFPDDPVSITLDRYTYTVTLKVVSGYWKFQIQVNNPGPTEANVHIGLYITLCAWKTL